MAKLNEPAPPPPESVDALKRRFIRQNREIARVNSNQSQRIRNLEIEISRLVAENISLREQAIAAQTEAERWRATNSINREILDLKDRLERKLEDVASMIVEMGNIPEKAARRGRRKSRASRAVNPSTSTEMDWKNRQSVREAMAEERGELLDGRLPIIPEDKLFPRKTLESAEVMALRDEAAMQEPSESPELGPPPIAHFDVPEPILFDAPAMSEVDSGGNMIQLPTILERRRKRRTSALLQDMPTEEVLEPEQPVKSTPAMLKSGAKRKLDVSELEEPSLQPDLDDGFVFQRRQEVLDSSAAGKKASRFTRPPGRENENSMETGGSSPQKNGGGSRKILAPKSTNSPTKRRVHVSGKLDVLKDDRDGHHNQAGGKPTRRTTFLPPVDTGDGADSNDHEGPKALPPKTPAAVGDDILSPISTEPSVRTGYQAKEAAILNSVEDVLNGSIGRGSRRARPAISYAEPNLRDKMRRPGKELVGAVEGIEKTRESDANGGMRSASMDRGRSEDEKEPQDRSVIRNKLEKDARRDERWKEMPLSMSMSKKEEPASPLRDKERKEKERDRGRTKINQRSRDSGPAPHDNSADDLGRAVDRLSIYDPPSSSPMDERRNSATSKDGITETEMAAPGTAKRKSSMSGLSRRHSVQPSSSSSISTTGESSKGGQASSSSAASDSKSAATPRPRSAANLNRSIPSTASAADLRGGKRSNSVASNLDSGDTPTGIEENLSNAPGNSTSSSTNAGSRAERSLNRRRSMMV